MAKRQEQAEEHRKRVRMQRPRGEELVRAWLGIGLGFGLGFGLRS